MKKKKTRRRIEPIVTTAPPVRDALHVGIEVTRRSRGGVVTDTLGWSGDELYRADAEDHAELSAKLMDLSNMFDGMMRREPMRAKVFVLLVRDDNPLRQDMTDFLPPNLFRGKRR